MYLRREVNSLSANNHPMNHQSSVNNMVTDDQYRFEPSSSKNENENPRNPHIMN